VSLFPTESEGGRLKRALLEAQVGALRIQQAELLAALKEHMEGCRDCSWLQVGEPARCQGCTRSAALIARIETPEGGG
jgi:hypothetical protein